jgi:hypothetical protein
LSCYRYIELNPVRAQGMAKHPSEYPWSSYRHNTLGQADTLVVPHLLYNGLGTTDEERQHTEHFLNHKYHKQLLMKKERQQINLGYYVVITLKI